MTSPKKKSSPIRAVAVKAVHDVQSGKEWIGPAIDKAVREHHPPLGLEEAAQVSRVVYGTLRHWHMLGAVLNEMLEKQPSKRVLALLACGLYERLIAEVPAHAVVNEYAALAKRGFAPAGLVNAVLRRAELPDPTSPEAKFSMPAALAARFSDVFGEQAEAVMLSALQPQPTWVRVFDATALEEFSEEDRGRAVDELHTQVLRWKGNIRNLESWQKGLLQPINPASAWVTEALGASENAEIYDLAAGASIKAALLAKRGHPICSVELHEAKHGPARANLKRLGVADRVELLAHDLTQPLDRPARSFVLLDAPCSGSGTLRAHPEIKLRLDEKSISELAELQGCLLQNAAQLVASGGALVYAVCSVLPEEGEAQISAFLEQNPKWKSEPLSCPLPHLQQAHGVLTLPLDGIDGFYVARLRAP